MRNGKLRAFLIALMLLVFASGLTFLLYPYLWGAMVDREISLNAQGFLNRDETAPTIPEVIVTIDSPTEPEETRDYPELWTDMVRYNETIYAQGQTRPPISPKPFSSGTSTISSRTTRTSRPSSTAGVISSTTLTAPSSSSFPL